MAVEIILNLINAKHNSQININQLMFNEKIKKFSFYEKILVRKVLTFYCIRLINILKKLIYCNI